MNPVKNNKKIDILSENLSRRIVILDGAMGTMIQNRSLGEEDYVITIYLILAIQIL